METLTSKIGSSNISNNASTSSEVDFGFDNLTISTEVLECLKDDHSGVLELTIKNFLNGDMGIGAGEFFVSETNRFEEFFIYGRTLFCIWDKDEDGSELFDVWFQN